VASPAEDAYELIKANIGRTKGVTDWFEITQDVVDTFAEVTGDSESSFLPMSLLSHFNLSLKGGDAAVPAFSNVVAGINYGFDDVRFGNPVKVNALIRATAVIKDVARKGDAVDEVSTITVEIQGENEPALVADWIIRTVFAPKEQP
jgi:acyl dehydratase